MKYRIDRLDDGGRVVEGVDLESLQFIPSGGTLLFVLPCDMLDVDLERARDEIHTFFGDARKTIVIRAGDAKVIYIADGGTSNG